MTRLEFFVQPADGALLVSFTRSGGHKVKITVESDDEAACNDVFLALFETFKFPHTNLPNREMQTMTNDNDQAQKTAIRLECLKLAVAQSDSHAHALIAARAYSDFALGKDDVEIVYNTNALKAFLYPKRDRN